LARIRQLLSGRVQWFFVTLPNFGTHASTYEWMCTAVFYNLAEFWYACVKFKTTVRAVFLLQCVSGEAFTAVKMILE